MKYIFYCKKIFRSKSDNFNSPSLEQGVVPPCVCVYMYVNNIRMHICVCMYVSLGSYVGTCVSEVNVCSFILDNNPWSSHQMSNPTLNNFVSSYFIWTSQDTQLNLTFFNRIFGNTHSVQDDRNLRIFFVAETKWPWYCRWHFQIHFLALFFLCSKFVLRSPIDNKSASVQAVDWWWTGNKPLPEPLMTQFTDAYIFTRPQNVEGNCSHISVSYCRNSF